MTLSRRRRFTIRALLVAGTVLAVAAIFAVWANRQVLNADNWSKTSAQLVQDPEIRTQLSEYLVDQTFATVDVQGELAAGLPPRLAPLAGPLSGGLRAFAQRVAVAALQRPRVLALWEESNRITAQQFINIADGNSKAITQSGNAVILDLRPLLSDLAARLGIPSGIVAKVPPTTAQIKIMSANDVSLLQDAVSAVRGLALVLPALALALLGLAVYLAEGRRRRTLMWAGISLGIAGVVVLVGRHLLGTALLDSLVKSDAARPAADNAWEIASAMLKDIAQATVIIGLPLIFAAWLAGPAGVATSSRRAMAPVLRDQPAAAYGAAAVIVLLIVAWGPIHATRLVVPVVCFFALTMFGVAALRRQTAEEFPDAVAGNVRSSFQRDRDDDSHVADLERLSTLHARGSLTDEEFAREKSAVLKNGTAA